METKTTREIMEMSDYQGNLNLSSWEYKQWISTDELLSILADFELELYSKQVISPKEVSIILNKHFKELLI
jgi:hypothetical protein